MAATDSKKQWRTNVFWKKDRVNFEPPVIKKPMVKKPVYIRKPRVVTLNKSSLASQGSAQFARHKSDEIDMIPTRDAGASSAKTSLSKEKTKVTLKDLSAEDKQRVANLVRELARVGEERELALTQLKEERSAFEERLEILQQEYDAIIKEKEYMQNRFLELQTLLKKYKSAEKENRRPTPPGQNNVETYKTTVGAFPGESNKLEDNTKPVPGTPEVRTSSVKIQDRKSLCHNGGANHKAMFIVPSSAPPVWVPPSSSTNMSHHRQKMNSDIFFISSSSSDTSKTQPVNIQSADLQNVGNSSAARLELDCSPTHSVQVQVTSRPQRTSVGGDNSSVDNKEDNISNLPQYYPLVSIPDSSQGTTAGICNTSGQQAITPDEFQLKYSAPAHTNRLFDQNIAQDGWRTLPIRSVDRSRTESTISHAVSAELDAVYRLHCREYELQLQLQQQQLELQRQQLQLQQQLQQLELFQQQNRPPDGDAVTKAKAVPSMGDTVLPELVPRPSSQPRQISPAVALVPTPDVQEIPFEKLSQDRSHQAKNISPTASQARSDRNTGDRSVELYQNSRKTTESHQRYTEEEKENASLVDHRNTSSHQSHLEPNHSETDRRCSMGISSNGMASQTPLLIEETLLDSRASSRMSLGRNSMRIAPPFANVASSGHTLHAGIAGETKRAETRSSVTLPGYGSEYAQMATPADQSAHFTARRDNNFTVDRASSRLSASSTDSTREQGSGRNYSLYQGPESAVLRKTLDGDTRNTESVSVNHSSQQTSPALNPYHNEQHFAHAHEIASFNSNNADPSLENQEMQKLKFHSLNSFDSQSTAQVPVFQENRHLLHSSSLSDGNSSNSHSLQQNRRREFTTLTKNDSPYHAKTTRDSNYPQTLVNIVQELEHNDNHPDLRQQGYYDIRHSAIYGDKENHVRQSSVEHRLQETSGDHYLMETDVRGLPRPPSTTFRETELGPSSRSYLFPDERRDGVARERFDFVAPVVNEERRNFQPKSDYQVPENSNIPNLGRSVRRPTSAKTFRTDTNDSGYSQDSYRDRSPLNSNREDWDTEEEEADVLNEIFFNNCRRR